MQSKGKEVQNERKGTERSNFDVTLYVLNAMYLTHCGYFAEIRLLDF